MMPLDISGLVKAANDLKATQNREEQLTDALSLVRSFSDTQFSVQYSLVNDGGDAGRAGIRDFVVSGNDLRRMAEAELRDATDRTQELQAAHDAIVLKYKLA